VESTKSLGDRGEQIAREFLARQGYQMVAANFRHRRKEIDIVAMRDGVLVFVEVKTRRTLAFGYPAEAVDGRKRAAIAACARAFLHLHGFAGRACRFDVVSIRLIPGADPEIEHISNAFPLGG
jgi:putative endonuclease